MNEEKSLPIAVEIRNTAKAQLNSIGPELRKSIVEGLVTAEKSRRLDILTKGFQVREVLGKERGRMKPDVVTHSDGEGGKEARWSDTSHKKKAKLTEALAKLDAAIEAALADTATNDEWAKLDKAISDADKNSGKGNANADKNSG